MPDIEIKNKVILPIVPLSGIVFFPKAVLTFDVTKPKLIDALERANDSNSLVFLSAVKDIKAEDYTEDNIYKIGTIAKPRQIVKLPGGVSRVVMEGLERAEVTEFFLTLPILKASVVPMPSELVDSKIFEVDALMRIAKDAFEAYSALTNRFMPDFIFEMLNCEDVNVMSDLILAHLQIKTEEKQRLLENLNGIERIGEAIKHLYYETQIFNIQRDIFQKVKTNVDKTQKDFYLREQIKVIKEELGDKDGVAAEIAAYRERITAAVLPEAVKEKLDKELKRLERSQNFSAETTVIRDYIDWVLDLEWSKKTQTKINLKKATDILNKDHYGLEKVKERIIEYLAVRLNGQNGESKLDAPILCLVGPPGVGKTSIAKSIARALNRKYVRMSLGGVRDEAEIRGHRKTYVGAMPGRIIYSLKQAHSADPLILLDEIDKMSSDFRGNPASALLEVLDGEQNKQFRDNYLEVPFDLSDVFFVCTANSMENVPPALIDRLEIINVSSYTREEKLNIATKYLIPKQLGKHGLKNAQFQLKSKAVEAVIRYYTKEAGVRQLERVIGELCRKAVKEIQMSDKKYIRITEANLEVFLGKQKYRHDAKLEEMEAGVAKGLAWTSVGGETLSIEVNTMKGTGKFELTGSMGTVMKESAQAAISFIRSKSQELHIKDDFYKETDIHIHIPEGATPKDGPSAGITMAVAMASALTGIPVKNNVGMTGEITIRGRVLPIGGLKEKVLAAKEAGLTDIILPLENEGDYKELPDYVKKDLNFVLVKNMTEVLDYALTQCRK